MELNQWGVKEPGLVWILLSVWIVAFWLRFLSEPISSVKESDVWPVPLFIEIKQASLAVDFLVVVLLLKAK